MLVAYPNPRSNRMFGDQERWCARSEILRNRRATRFIIQLIAEDETKSQSVHQIAVLDRDILAADTLGLWLGEAKTLLGTLQSIMIADQVADLVRHEQVCSGCSRLRPVKDHRTIAMRTLFGKLAIGSPRFRCCGCDGHGRATISPVVAALPRRVTPELLQVEIRRASLASFGVTADLLPDVLPIGGAINAATIRNDVLRVAGRLDGALGPGQAMFVDGCQAEWDELPVPDRACSTQCGSATSSDGTCGSVHHCRRSSSQPDVPKEFYGLHVS